MEWSHLKRSESGEQNQVWPITIYRNHVCVVQYHSAGQSQNNQTDTVATKRGNLIQTGQEIWRKIFRQYESKKKKGQVPIAT